MEPSFGKQSLHNSIWWAGLEEGRSRQPRPPEYPPPSSEVTARWAPASQPPLSWASPCLLAGLDVTSLTSSGRSVLSMAWRPPRQTVRPRTPVRPTVSSSLPQILIENYSWSLSVVAMLGGWDWVKMKSEYII